MLHHSGSNSDACGAFDFWGDSEILLLLLSLLLAGLDGRIKDWASLRWACVVARMLERRVRVLVVMRW